MDKIEQKLKRAENILSNPGLNRRSLLTRAGIVGAAALGAGLLGESTPSADAAVGLTFGPKGDRIKVNDYDILNFALNLEYLEAEFYQLAANGKSLTDIDPTLVLPGAAKGTGTPGTLTRPTGTLPVPFESTAVAAYAQEIAADELAHVQFLRAALGKFAVAEPSINVSEAAFTAAALAATAITSAQTFSPYSTNFSGALTADASFLLGAFIFEDVGVTAYHGAAPYLSSAKGGLYVTKATGILAVEAYHAAEVRLQLIQMGGGDPNNAIIATANKISALRDAASAAADGATPTDQGITLTSGTTTTTNVVPTDANSIAFARSFGAVLNIVYLNTTATPSSGGFFPAGLNGRITTLVPPTKKAK